MNSMLALITRTRLISRAAEKLLRRVYLTFLYNIRVKYVCVCVCVYKLVICWEGALTR